MPHNGPIPKGRALGFSNFGGSVLLVRSFDVELPNSDGNTYGHTIAFAQVHRAVCQR